jgi:hypothetical protein
MSRVGATSDRGADFVKDANGKWVPASAMFATTGSATLTTNRVNLRGGSRLAANTTPPPSALPCVKSSLYQATMADQAAEMEARERELRPNGVTKPMKQRGVNPYAARAQARAAAAAAAAVATVAPTDATCEGGSAGEGGSTGEQQDQTDGCAAVSVPVALVPSPAHPPLAKAAIAVDASCRGTTARDRLEQEHAAIAAATAAERANNAKTANDVAAAVAAGKVQRAENDRANALQRISTMALDEETQRRKKTAGDVMDLIRAAKTKANATQQARASMGDNDGAGTGSSRNISSSAITLAPPKHWSTAFETTLNYSPVNLSRRQSNELGVYNSASSVVEALGLCASVASASRMHYAYSLLAELVR